MLKKEKLSELEGRFLKSKTVLGTHSFHHFILLTLVPTIKLAHYDNFLIVL